MKHPRWCLKFISPNEIHAVSNAVKSAEAATTGEIIPMIVRRSASLGHLGFQIFTIATLLATFLYIALDRFAVLEHAAWIAMGLAVVLWPVSEQLARLSFIQRLFTGSADREWQVHARATLEFYAAGLQKTKDRTGVLIFLSLMERKCVVLADEGIAAKLPPETWNSIVERIIQGIRDGKTGEGLMTGIAECGRILTEHFPAAQGSHINEISNQLLIKD